VREGVRITRDDLVRAFALKNAFLTSVHPANATACAMLSQVRAEIEDAHRAGPVFRTKLHPQTQTVLQGLARLRELARPKRGKDGEARIAGDAEAVILLQLVDAHVELAKARGFELPEATTGTIDEVRTWRGPEIAAAIRFSRADLLPFYRRTLAAVVERAAATAERAKDPAIAAQYQELAAWAGNALESLRIRVVRS